MYRSGEEAASSTRAGRAGTFLIAILTPLPDVTVDVEEPEAIRRVAPYGRMRTVTVIPGLIAPRRTALRTHRPVWRRSVEAPVRTPDQGVSVPARAAYSHCASVGRARPIRLTTFSHVHHETHSTGLRGPTLCPQTILSWWLLGLYPVNRSHCACVISYFDRKKACTVTSRTGPSHGWARGS